MALAKYTYAKVVSPDTLEYQIRGSVVSVALEKIEASVSSVDIWFKATLSSNDESILTALVSVHVAIPMMYQGDPKDPDGSRIYRPKAAKAGWVYQMHSVNFYTSNMSSLHSYSVNPVTRVKTPLNFASIKFYDENNTELIEPSQMDRCVWTVMDWCTTHELEVIGGKLLQTSRPLTDAYLWMHLAPGILNYPFLEGGLNLRLMDSAGVNADGRASKYMHSSIPMPGLNKFRTTINHAPGLVHEMQCIFEFFKPIV